MVASVTTGLRSARGRQHVTVSPRHVNGQNGPE
jgi:hypothetical protein